MKSTSLLWILFALAVIPAAYFDARVASWVHGHNVRATLHSWHWPLAAKLPGHFGYCTLPVALAVGIFTHQHWRGSALVALSGITSGLLYVVIKWFVGRTRPFPQHAPAESPFAFHPFVHGLSGLWKAENQAFPSGHTCLAFATAASLTRLLPRGGPLFFIIAGLTAIERVLEGAHYPSDVCAGAAWGILAAGITDWTLRTLWSDNRDHELTRRIAVVPLDPKPPAAHRVAGSSSAGGAN